MAEERVPILLNLASLIEGIPALTPALGGTLAEAATVCFANQGHGESCLLPAYIVVVEFGTPMAWMEQDEQS